MPIPAGSGTIVAPTSGPLVYDPVLSRVRINLSGLLAADTFGRTVSGEWGTSESGHTWLVDGAAAAQFLVAGGVGVHRVNALNTRFRSRTTGLVLDDVNLRVTVRLDTAPSGNYIRTELAARVVDDNNFYTLRAHVLTSGLIDLQLIRVVGGVETPVAAVPSGITHTAGMSLHLRFHPVGSTLRGRVWRDDAVEPTTWQITATDSVHAAGGVAVSTLFPPGNTNTLPYDVLYDGLSAVPTVTVERSTDQVRWTTVRGGHELVPDAGHLRLDDYEFAADLPNHYRVGQLFTGSIVPVLGRVWLKSLARPFLNRQVTVVDYSDVERPSRAGVFEVVGRSLPVSVNDVRGSRRWTLDVLTGTADDAEDLDLLLAAGDVLFVHAPAGSGVPEGYVVVGDTRQRRTSRLGARRVFELPCTEVAAPGPDVIGSTVTCQTVLNTYPTCQAVLAAHDTCLSLMELIGDPTDVIVP